MANQLDTTISVIAQEGQSVTVLGPSGQQVTVAGPGGKFTITFTSDVVNVIPLDHNPPQQVPEEDVVLPNNLPLFVQWPAAEPGSFFHKIDTLANSGKQTSAQFSNAELQDLISLKMMNVGTFYRTFARLNLSAQASRNVQTRIRRLMNPELRREYNRRSLERYHRIRRERMAAAMA